MLASLIYSEFWDSNFTLGFVSVCIDNFVVKFTKIISALDDAKRAKDICCQTDVTLQYLYYVYLGFKIRLYRVRM